MARRTAFSEPGRLITIVPRARPAHARLSIAAGPISSKLRARNSSAEAVDALVEQLRNHLVGSVPPGDPGAARGDDDVDVRLADRVRDGSPDAVRIVGHDRLPRHVVALPARSSTMARPLRSVASVRVSLTVTTEQRVLAGASARWVTWLTPEL